MATVLDTFITRFGFETDKTGLRKAEKGLGDFKATAIKIAASIGGILAGGFFLKVIAETADETIKWADANGLVIETLGELEFATQRQGGTVEGLRASLSNMNKAIGEVARGTGRAKLAFEDYGLSVKKANGQTKTADELLIDLNKKFATLSKAQQFDLAMKMGIDKGTIRLLQTAPDEIARLRMEAARLGVLSRRDAVKAAEFVDGMTNIAQAINAIKFEVAGIVFKPLADFFKIIANGIAFFRQHKDVMLILIGIIGAVGAAYVAMGIKAAAAWIATFLPITIIPALIGAVAIALAILIEDFIAFFKGQDSAIGDLVKKWPALGWAIFAIRDAVVIMFNETVTGFKNMWNWLTKIGNGIIEFLLDPINKVSDLIKNLPGFGKLSKAFGFNNKAGSSANQTLNQKMPIIGAPSPLSQALSENNTSVSKTSDVRVGEIKIDARGSDSTEIAQNIDSALRDQLQNTVEDFDSKIER